MTVEAKYFRSLHSLHIDRPRLPAWEERSTLKSHLTSLDFIPEVAVTAILVDPGVLRQCIVVVGARIGS